MAKFFRPGGVRPTETSCTATTGELSAPTIPATS